MIVAQWRGVHGVEGAVARDRIGAHLHCSWYDASGRVAIEEYAIAGMGHGVPIASTGSEACGTPGPFILDVGISSTYRISASWEIVPAATHAPQPVAPADAEFGMTRVKEGEYPVPITKKSQRQVGHLSLTGSCIGREALR